MEQSKKRVGVDRDSYAKTPLDYANDLAEIPNGKNKKG